MDIKIEGFSSLKSKYYQATLNIRASVFVEELAYDKHLEFDGKDDGAMHYILFYDMVPAGCARWNEKSGEISIDRFCISKEFRKRGLALVLIKFIVSELLPSKKRISILSSDDGFIFFTQAGFKDSGSNVEFGRKKLRILNFVNG